MEKVRILCFWDSYTWWYIPGTDHERFSENVRFPKLLQKLLGENFEIIEEWLNSRTLVSEDKRIGKEGRNGSTYLVPCLDSHDPLDLVILMLGTNELKYEYWNSAEQIGKIFEDYFVKVTLKRKSQFKNKHPRVLILSLPIINEKTEYASKRYTWWAEKWKQLNNIYKEIAERNKCDYIDTSWLIIGSDGVHLTKEGQIKLAEMLYEKITKTIFS